MLKANLELYHVFAKQQAHMMELAYATMLFILHVFAILMRLLYLFR